MCNHMPNKVWDEIIHPYPKFNGAAGDSSPMNQAMFCLFWGAKPLPSPRPICSQLDGKEQFSVKHCKKIDILWRNKALPVGFKFHSDLIFVIRVIWSQQWFWHWLGIEQVTSQGQNHSWLIFLMHPCATKGQSVNFCYCRHWSQINWSIASTHCPLGDVVAILKA